MSNLFTTRRHLWREEEIYVSLLRRRVNRCYLSGDPNEVYWAARQSARYCIGIMGDYREGIAQPWASSDREGRKIYRAEE